MTFTLPADLATQFLKHVRVRDRSSHVSEAIAARLRAREEQLIRTCEIANSDPDLLKIERELDALRDEIAEPWNDAPAGGTS